MTKPPDIWKGAMLQDQFGREFSYLRLSITDVCNFSCNYCLPDGYQKSDSVGCASEQLNLKEIEKLVEAFSRLGTQKIRITGGEPAIRKDLPEVIKICKQTPGIQTVSITTNGYKLPQYIDDWVDAGLDRINVSIDSLDPRMFKSITGHNRLDEVLSGIHRADQLGIEKIKINAVLMRQFNLKEFDTYIDWIKDKPFTLRFIELMRTGDNQAFFEQNHISGQDIKTKLLNQGWSRILRSKSAGPAQEFQHSDSKGKIGLIMPYSKDFCNSCNRLRVSSQGKLHLCLFGEQGFNLRQAINHQSIEELMNTIRSVVTQKGKSHYLQEGITGSTRHLSMLGG